MPCNARGQRCSSQTHKNQGLQLLGSRCCRYKQPKATCCFVVPLQLHAKLLQVQIHLGVAMFCQVQSLRCWVLNRTRNRQLTCAAPQHVPAGVCPALPGACSRPRSGSMRCPAAWQPSGPSGLSTPAAGCAALLQSQHVSGIMPSPGLPQTVPCQTPVGKELQKHALHLLSTRSAASIEQSVCALPATGFCSCAGHCLQPVWHGTRLHHWHMSCRARTHNSIYKPLISKSPR